EILPGSFPYVAPTDVVIDGKLNLSTIRAVFTILAIFAISTFKFGKGNEVRPSGRSYISPLDVGIRNAKLNFPTGRPVRSLGFDSSIDGPNPPVSIVSDIWGQTILSVLSVLALQFFKGDQILPGILSHPSPLESVKSFLDFNFPT